MSNWGNCPNCREYDILSGSKFLIHRCKPAWECRMETDDADDWRRVHAGDDETAAEKFAEEHDRDCGDYPILNNGGDSYQVWVRKPGEEEVKKFFISAESVPHYSAYPED